MSLMPAKESSKSNCIHKKNIPLLIDLNPTDGQYKSLHEHLKSCSVCQKELARFEELNLAAQVFIPKPVMDKELKDSFDRELHDLLKSFGIEKKSRRKKKALTKLSKLNSFGEAMLKNLFSKTMIYSMTFGGVIYFAMKYMNGIK